MDEQRTAADQPAEPDQPPVDPESNVETGSDEDEESGVRALYKRLAREYEKHPIVPDHGGGVPGDRYL
jgi:hypothetical protein